jgi:hypothetical protein
MIVDKLINYNLYKSIAKIKKEDIDKKIFILDTLLIITVLLSLTLGFFIKQYIFIISGSLILIFAILFNLTFNKYKKAEEDIKNYFDNIISITRNYYNQPEEVIIKRLSETKFGFLTEIFKYMYNHLHKGVEVVFNEIKNDFRDFVFLTYYIDILLNKRNKGIDIRNNLDFLSDSYFKYRTSIDKIESNVKSKTMIIPFIIFLDILISQVLIYLFHTFLKFSNAKSLDTYMMPAILLINIFNILLLIGALLIRLIVLKDLKFFTNFLTLGIILITIIVFLDIIIYM